MIASRWRCDAVHIHQLLPPIIKSYKHRFQTGTKWRPVIADLLPGKPNSVYVTGGMQEEPASYQDGGANGVDVQTT